MAKEYFIAWKTRNSDSRLLRMKSKILYRVAASFAASIILPFITMDAALAATYPSRPIRWIVAYPPGGTTDVIVRLVAPELGKRLGQYIVIENRAGGAAIVGTHAAATAAPDGYTLSVGYITTHAIHPNLMKSLPYDPIKDFIPISLMAKAPVILVVNPSLPVKSVKELVAYAKARPGQLNNSSPGNGSPPHLAGELFKKLAGLDIVHVPYKGSPEALQDTMTGAVQLTFGGVATAMPHIRAGKLRALGISSLETSPLAPETPPISRSGFPGFESTSWWGMSVRAGVPKDVVMRLNTEIVKVIQLPEIRERFASLGVVATSSTPAEFDAYIRAETKKWGDLIREHGIKID
jgi:tripartite-type tricarboxylate transporter receptor subunit TctC